MLQASLKVIGGKHDGQLIPFKTPKFLVGREHDCHLRPNSDLVSRHHCVFGLDDYGLRLRDLGSTNGTLVNGRQIRGEIVLMAGDVVRIGKLNLEVMIGNREGEPDSHGPSVAEQETMTNASALDTAFEMPLQPMTLEDSGSYTSPSEDTAQFEMPGLSGDTPKDLPVIDGQPLIDAPEAPAQQPVGFGGQEQPGMTGYPPQGPVPPGYWQYPQYPQYPPNYPMPGYPPQGYPPQQYPYPMPPGQYPPPGYQQMPAPQAPPPAQDSGSNWEAAIPSVRLPDPSETGVKAKPPAPAAPPDSAPKPAESTPSQKAADLIKQRSRRRTEE